jgi:hypothetical protein
METLKLSKYSPLTTIEIWHPLYSQRKVLLSCAKVDGAKTDYLRIVFTKAKSMEGDWAITKKKARTFAKQTNGVMQCYAVPLDELRILEIVNREPQEIY